MQPTQPDGYLSLPKSNSGGAVLVLHAWWGLNDSIRAFCDRLAEAGFTAFAPDLYHGQVADTIPGAERLAQALNEDLAKAEVLEAASFLAGTTGQSLAVIGFSLGAFFALDLSASMADKVHSVVVFYGTGPADFNRSKAAYLGHYAGNDPYEEDEYVEWLEQALAEAGRPVTFHHYPGTGHWFFEPDRQDAYDAGAAELAWERTLAFLNR